MELCKECLNLIELNLSESDKFTLKIIAENNISNKEDIIGLVKVLSRKEKNDIITSKSGINSTLNRLKGGLLINVNNIGRQKLYSINENGNKILQGAINNENRKY